MPLDIFFLPGLFGDPPPQSSFKLAWEDPIIRQHQSFHSLITYLEAKIPTDSWIIGYSFGGRVAQAWAAAHPTRQSRIILASTHPGLRSHQEQEQRLLADQKWASRFCSQEPWETLLNDWYHQPPLRHTTSANPLPCHKDPQLRSFRETRAHLLTHFSLGAQPLRHERAPLSSLWMVGQRDPLYQQYCQDLNPWIVTDAGHRLFWDQPERAEQMIFDWIKQHP